VCFQNVIDVVFGFWCTIFILFNESKDAFIDEICQPSKCTLMIGLHQRVFLENAMSYDIPIKKNTIGQANN